jgi:hypothetical protein
VRLLKFGQPAGAPFQVAYTVDDMPAAVARYTEHLKVRPWFTLDYRASSRARYRGQPTSLHCSIVRGFVGNINVELILQLDDGPSVYRETIARQGHGFHHWGIGSVDFDRDVEHYRSLGYEVALYDVGPLGNRLAYMDTTRDMPGMVEITEMTEHQENFLQRMQAASVNFDGKDLVRGNNP